MKLGIQEVGGAFVARVEGTRLVFAGLDSFMERLSPCVARERAVLILDMEEVDYVDSAAIGCIMDLYRQAAEQQGFFGLSGLQPRVRTMLRMTGAHEMIGFFDTVDDALRGAGDASGEVR